MKIIKSAKTSWMKDAEGKGLEPMDLLSKYREETGTDPVHDERAKRKFCKWAEEQVKSCNAVNGGAAATVAKMVAPVVIDKIADKVFDNTDSCNKVDASQDSDNYLSTLATDLESKLSNCCDSVQFHNDDEAFYAVMSCNGEVKEYEVPISDLTYDLDTDSEYIMNFVTEDVESCKSINSASSSNADPIDEIISKIEDYAKEYGVAQVRRAEDELEVTLYDDEADLGTEDFISTMTVDFSDEDVDTLSDPDYIDNTAYAIINDLANDNYGDIIRGPKF